MMPVACQGIPDSDVCEHIGLPSDEKVHRLSRVICGCLFFPKINLNLLTKSALKANKFYVDWCNSCGYQFEHQ